jgi:thymidylate synthase (FAD)
MDIKVEVLDHGFVEYVSHNGDDKTALVAARISTNNPTGVDEKKDKALLTRLWRDQHTSPFEMPDLTLNLQLPLFCLRQLDRHRTLDYSEGTMTETLDENTRKYFNRNEFSGRYSEMPDLFYAPKLERIKGKHSSNKQSSGDAFTPDEAKKASILLEIATRTASTTYQELIKMGVASELARIILPLNQYTKIQLKGNLLNWFKMLNLRMRMDVQEETREYANAISTVVERIWPNAYEVFMEHTFNAQLFSWTERKILKAALKGDSEFYKLEKAAIDAGMSTKDIARLISKVSEVS